MNFIKAFDEYCSIEKNIPAPILRKSFCLDFVPEKADIAICVSGFYDLYLNGKKITKGYLAPYINNPDHILYKDVYDISGLLNKGKNAVAVVLGNGFANQDVDFWDFKYASFRQPLCMSVELNAYGEGVNFALTSDDSFKVCSSPILFDMYRYGVIYDARKEIPGFAEAEFDDSSWDNATFAIPPKGKITISEAIPVKEQYELKPVSIERQQDFCYLYDDDLPIQYTHISDGWLYDFGLNCAGVCRLKIKGKKGQKVILRHCESLKNGKFNINSIFTLREDMERYIHLYQSDVYILNGDEEEIFIPPFTYHGFRYVLVEGITENQATEDLLTYVVLNTDLKKRSDFECSDEIVNKLYEIAIRADISNFHHFPTDCPHREKNGWTGDISLSAHQYLLSFNCSQSLKVWLDNVRCAQTREGKLPGIIPTDTWGYDWGCGPGWDCVIASVPYYSYKYDGRKDIITDNAHMIMRYFEYISSKRDENGLVACGLGDWVQPRKQGEEISSPLIFTDSMHIVDMAKKSAVIFDAVGMNKEKEYAQNLYYEMKEAVKRHLINHTTCTAIGNCQTSQAMAIGMGMFEEDEYPKAYRRLIEFIEEKDYHINCGILGIRHIFHVLFENGDADIALRMITRDDAPSYGSMIKLGGTALFESLIPNGVQNSQNHHFQGDIINLFITKLAGIRINPHMNDTHNVLISPIVPECIDFAKASYDFEDGKLSVEWKKDKDKLIIIIDAPEAVHGEIEFKGSKIPLLNGKNIYNFNL